MGIHVTRTYQLLLTASIATAASWLLIRVSYASFPPLSPFFCLSIFFIAAVDVWAGSYVRRRVRKGEVGQDRTQLNPLVAMRLLALGKASAWFGALLCGVTLGIGLYVWPKSSEVIAAQNDTWALVLTVISSTCLSAAGIWLEKSCEVPPSNRDEQSRETPEPTPVTG